MDWAKQWGAVAAIGVIGVGLVGYGVWEQIKPRAVQVEIIKDQGASVKDRVGGEVVVDVAGAVEKPGIYKLPANSRIGDALVMAGGLAAVADRAWVSQNLNLAEKIEDGGKIYIPRKSENSENLMAKRVGGSENLIGQKTNINTASTSELDSLDGIGSVRAKTIIDNRPYSKIEEIVSKAKIPESVYDKIKDRITVY